MNDPISDIQKQYRKIVYCALTTAASMIFGLFSLLYSPLIGVSLIVLAVILYFVLFRPNRSRYADLVNETILERTICRLIGSPVPKPVGGGIFTKQMLLDSDLVPEGGDDTDPLFCWEMKGHRKIFEISLADTTLIQKFMGNNGKYTYHTTSGVFSVFDLPQDPQRYFIFMDRQFLPDPVRELFMNAKSQYVRESLSDTDLDERYFFYRSTRDSGGAVPATFLQSLKRLMNYTPGQVAICVKGSTMYAFINDRFVSIRVALSKTITMEDLDRNEFPELSYLINIAATLGVGNGKTGSNESDQDNEEEKEG